MDGNILYYGDNLDILRRYVKDETVDLIYLDPPFNSNQAYNVLFEEKNGSRSSAQIQAFDDTWHWDMTAAEAYEELVEAGGNVAQALVAFRWLLGETDMMAYLAMMAPRLVELQRVLKPTGSLYLHCDPTASHYLKLLLDSVFGGRNFRNEITWKRTHSHGDPRRRFGKISDTLLFYARSSDHTFNPQYLPYSQEYIDRYYRHVEDDGRRYQLVTLRSPNPRPNLMYEYKGYKPHPNGWAVSKEKMAELDRQGRLHFPSRPDGAIREKYYLDEMPGVVAGDIWADIPPVSARAAERLSYPTQKPEALLERIIKASSNEGELVLDPFCGCGTTVAVAERLNRRWIGIDITHLAVTLMKHRLKDSFGEEVQYEVIGEPTSLPVAEALAKQDPFQFQWWALGLVGARPQEQKKGPDRGIDGRIFFHDEPKGGKTKQIVLSVKAGRTTVAHVRDLRGVVEREDAALGVLITVNEPTKPMRTETAAGFYSLPWDPDRRFPKLQILTIEELLAGKQIDCPPLHQAAATFKRAPKARKPKAKTNPLPLEQPDADDES